MSSVEQVKPRGLTDVPAEVLLEHLLPALPLKDLTLLSAVNRYFYALANDETLWLHLTQSTFRLSPHSLAPPAPQSGWSKRVYAGLLHPRTYVWGSADNGRLGLPRPSPGNVRILIHLRFVHTPRDITEQFDSGQRGRTWGVALRDSLAAAAGRDGQGDGRGGAGGEGGEGIGSGDAVGKEVGVVELQAGGWSFTARDMDGGIWVWGQLDGSMIAFRANSWEDKCCQVPEPTRIPLPCRVEAVSCGRRHLLVLDSDNLIWELRDWGRAYHHTAPTLTSPTNPGASSPGHIAQLSAGWSHSACLTSTGKIHVWYPFSEVYRASLTPNAELNGPLGVVGEDDSRAVRWGKVGDIVHELEDIPPRPEVDGDDDDVEPELESNRTTRDDSMEGERHRGARRTREEIEEEWNKAAPLDGVSREKGEKVVKIASGSDFLVALKANGEVWFHRAREGEVASWEYLPYFSGPSVSHLTAQFEALTSYSPTTSRVFHTRLPSHPPPTFGGGFGAALRPDPLPELQGKGVIQVALGDYHTAALTSRGEMWTWGEGTHGQLGLGGPLGTVDQPRKVRFPGDEVERPAAEGLGEDWAQRREAQMSENRGDRDSSLWVPEPGAGAPGADSGLEGKTEKEYEKESERHRVAKANNTFVFSIAAAGWHTGALVLGDPSAKSKTQSQSQSSEQVASTEQSSDTAGSTAPSRPPQSSTNTNESRDQPVGGQMPGAFPFGSGGGGGGGSLAGPIFRVGFAGRGSTIGNVAQRNWQARAARGGGTNPQQHAVQGELPREATGANEDDAIEGRGERAETETETETEQDVVSRWQQPGFE